MKLPKNYENWKSRVSDIVEFIYPFKNSEDERRFISWLNQKWIELEDYMKEASEWWTHIHKQIENFINSNKVKVKKEYKDFYNNWIQWIEESGVVPIASEVYISTKDFQWTIDLIWEIDWEKWILDFKTYWLAKYKFWLQNKYKKPYDKLKKAQLQLSLYWYAKNISNLWVIELTKDNYYFHKIDILPKKQIQKIIKEYKFYKNNLQDICE